MFGLFRVRSPLLAESLLFSLPVGTEMVHFPTLSSTAYGFSGGSFGISQRGFPHSDIPGSKPICGSPGLIAAYRVLHRLLAPRHSPYALSSLTIRNSELTPSDLARRVTAPHAIRPREFHAHCNVRVVRFRISRCIGGLRRTNVWSEKTTVCRIFSCQRTHAFATFVAPARRALRPVDFSYHSAASRPAKPQRRSRFGGAQL